MLPLSPKCLYHHSSTPLSPKYPYNHLYILYIHVYDPWITWNPSIISFIGHFGFYFINMLNALLFYFPLSLFLTFYVTFLLVSYYNTRLVWQYKPPNMISTCRTKCKSLNFMDICIFMEFLMLQFLSSKEIICSFKNK
jgi:hypothetical protein